MTVRDMAKICKKRKVLCNGCEHADFCLSMLPEELESASPAFLVELLDKDVEEIKKRY